MLALLMHVDFFCVGTNDLTQYTLAAARDDAAVNDYHLDGHESVLRLLGIILADAVDRMADCAVKRRHAVPEPAVRRARRLRPGARMN